MVRSALPGHLGRLQDLAVGVSQRLRVELLPGLLLLALGWLSEAEQVVVEQGADRSCRDLVEVHCRVVENSRNWVGRDLDVVVVVDEVP